MTQLSKGNAYLFWCLCLLGLCGGQRFYVGQPMMGIIYLFTGGGFLIGQILDLALIPGMVENRNVYLRGRYGGGHGAQQNVVVNVGAIPQAAPPAPIPTVTPTQKLLRVAQKNGGTLTLGQAVMATGLDSDGAKKLLVEMQRQGLADVTNDEKTGAVRYTFDV